MAFIVLFHFYLPIVIGIKTVLVTQLRQESSKHTYLVTFSSFVVSAHLLVLGSSTGGMR